MTKGTNSISSATSKLAETQDLISTMFHEAGHVVYGLLHLMKIDFVRVFKDDDNRMSGLTQYISPELKNISDNDLLFFIINSEICIKYAGLTAEKYQFKTMSGSDKFPLFLKDGSSDDTLSAAKLFIKYNLVSPGKKRYLYKKKLIKQTSDVLRTYWSSVTLIAHGLFQKKKLTHEDLKQILTKKSEHKDFWKSQFKAIDSIYGNLETLDEESFKDILIDRGMI